MKAFLATLFAILLTSTATADDVARESVNGFTAGEEYEGRTMFVCSEKEAMAMSAIAYIMRQDGRPMAYYLQEGVCWKQGNFKVLGFEWEPFVEYESVSGPRVCYMGTVETPEGAVVHTLVCDSSSA
jgi:hypothetical protein